MKRIEVDGIQFSSLGFGCTQLAANFSRRAALGNLETAYDSGITHYDTARAYGFGMAESIMAPFIKGKRDKISISSKIGILPKAIPVKNLFILNVLRAGLNVSSAVRRSAIAHTGGANQEVLFSESTARQSLEASLKALNTDYLDILLLHESSVEYANKEEAIGFLQQLVKTGKIRAFGIATQYKQLPQDLRLLNSAYKILQFESNPLDVSTLQHLQERFTILHSVFRSLGSVSQLLAQNKLLADTLSERAGVDLSSKQALSECFLRYAAFKNPDGLTLITSRHNQRIRENIHAWNHSRISTAQIPEIFNMIREALPKQ